MHIPSKHHDSSSRIGPGRIPESGTIDDTKRIGPKHMIIYVYHFAHNA